MESSNFNEQLKQLKQSLPKEQWINGPLYLYQGFWAPRFDNLIAFQNHFLAQDTDIFIASCRKAGTTWLKALIFAICDRENHQSSVSPLLNHNPHELIPGLESIVYRNSNCPGLSTHKSPRLFGTHIPFPSLPSSIKNDTNCKIIYICRNPLDTLVSSWFFYLKVEDNQTLKPDMLDLYVDMFCQGKIPFGPFEDHVLGYWKESLERPNKVVFVKYEDLKGDPVSQLTRMAEFLEMPFTSEEVKHGVVDDIIKLCSFQKMSEVAAPGNIAKVIPNILNESLFRKGNVGDWVNYLSLSQAVRVTKVMEEKFRGSGLRF